MSRAPRRAHTRTPPGDSAGRAYADRVNRNGPLGAHDDRAPDPFDEAFADDGAPRPLYADLLAALADAELRELAASAQAHVERRGITFAGKEGEQSFRLDAVPRLIESSEWRRLAAGLGQRAAALEAFVADVYAERRIVAAGRIPGWVVDEADHLESLMHGIEMPGGYAVVAGFDVVRDSRGELRVLEDNLRTPSGFTYAMAAREAVERALNAIGIPELLDPATSYRRLREALERAVPPGGSEVIVVLSEGTSSAAFFEHRGLADAIGIPLVEPGDLAVREGRLVARLDGSGPTEVGVVLRRADEDRLTDDCGGRNWLADLLLEPMRRGALSVVNGFGSGVGDDKLAYAYIEEMVRFYLGEEPLVRSVRTYDLHDASAREEVLERIDEMVVKPRGGEGGEGVIVCRHAEREDRERAARLVREHPGEWIAQETVTLSTHPTISGDALEPRHVDLRAFTVGGEAVPAPLTRFALEAGALVVNSSQGGGGKDTWILA